MAKPVGVWMLLKDGKPWNYENFRTLDEAMPTARTLRGVDPGFLAERVWIAPPATIGKATKRRTASPARTAGA